MARVIELQTGMSLKEINAGDLVKVRDYPLALVDRVESENITFTFYDPNTDSIRSYSLRFPEIISRFVKFIGGISLTGYWCNPKHYFSWENPNLFKDHGISFEDKYRELQLAGVAA